MASHSAPRTIGAHSQHACTPFARPSHLQRLLEALICPNTAVTPQDVASHFQSNIGPFLDLNDIHQPGHQILLNMWREFMIFVAHARLTDYGFALRLVNVVAALTQAGVVHPIWIYHVVMEAYVGYSDFPPQLNRIYGFALKLQEADLMANLDLYFPVAGTSSWWPEYMYTGRIGLS